MIVALSVWALSLWPYAAAATLTVGIDAPTVQQTIDLALAGDTVVLPDGIWPGNVVVDKTITLTSRGGILDGGQTGTALTIDAPDVIIERLAVQGGGTSLAGSSPDACMRLTERATNAMVRDSELSDCTFGIWVHQTRGAKLFDNRIRAREMARPSERGNGIQLFNGDQLVVRGNVVTGSRDGIYVSATDYSTIAYNEASDVRYGIHYMYSEHNVVLGNRMSGCSGGIALMQSLHLIVIGNHAYDNKDKGILFRDLQYSVIRSNRVEGNLEGLFFFSCLDNEIIGNIVSGNEIGARVWAGTERNIVTGNAFINNRQQLFYVSAYDQTWDGNTWSDYLGWDQDGDGRGDRPYRVDSYVAGLLFRYPAAVLLLSSPSLEMLRYLEERMPALRTPTVIDTEPMLRWETP